MEQTPVNTTNTSGSPSQNPNSPNASRPQSFDLHRNLFSPPISSLYDPMSSPTNLAFDDAFFESFARGLHGPPSTSPLPPQQSASTSNSGSRPLSPHDSAKNSSDAYPGVLSNQGNETSTRPRDIYRSNNSSSVSIISIGHSSGSGSMHSATYGNSLRHNPLGTRFARMAARGGLRGEDNSSDEVDDAVVGESTKVSGGALVSEALAKSRKEASRRQRIEAEHRRRDELREGYAKLKDALPVSNQKSSKISLLERAATHIRALDASQNALQTQLDALQTRLADAESELTRLRNVNEQLMRNLMEQNRAITLSALAAATAAANSTSTGVSRI